MLLPVGGFQKPQIRELAGEVGLNVADKRDSQEICFVTSGRHGEFIRAKHDVDTSGNFVDAEGNVLGQHVGIENFTIGQRKGLGVAFGEPRYVIRIDAETNNVVLGEKHELAMPGLVAEEANWLCDLLVSPFAAQVQIRYNSPPVDATVCVDAEQSFSVKFAAAQNGVAPGQLCVVYDQDRVLGGGWIKSAT
jgi:tRNA-specific 2-thiouridylase